MSLSRNPLHPLYEKYAAGVAYLEVETPMGELQIGSAFHVKDNVFVTCRHVVEGNHVRSIATTCGATDGMRKTFWPSVGRLAEEPRFHPDKSVDVAVLRVEGITAPAIPIASLHPLELPVLSPVLVLGYPPIPLSAKPVLAALSAEVTAVVDTYESGVTQVILSSMARGGMSGGIAVIQSDAYGHEGVLGIVTRSLVQNNQPSELGYLAILPLEIITSVCHGLFHSRLDWYFCPGREAAAEATTRGAYRSKVHRDLIEAGIIRDDPPRETK